MACGLGKTVGRGETAHARARRAGGKTPADAVDGRREAVRIRRTERQGKPARSVRGAPAADRLPRLLRSQRLRLARPCLPRLLTGCRPGLAPFASERPRYDACLRLARAAAGDRAVEGKDGLEDA